MIELYIVTGLIVSQFVTGMQQADNKGVPLWKQAWLVVMWPHYLGTLHVLNVRTRREKANQ